MRKKRFRTALFGYNKREVAAYVLTMEMWHQETVAIIRAGAEANAFTLTDRAENIAWRLIGLVCGLDGITILNMPEMDDAAFNKHLDKLISLELG